MIRPLVQEILLVITKENTTNRALVHLYNKTTEQLCISFHPPLVAPLQNNLTRVGNSGGTGVALYCQSNFPRFINPDSPLNDSGQLEWEWGGGAIYKPQGYCQLLHQTVNIFRAAIDIKYKYPTFLFYCKQDKSVRYWW